eukprot:TRINITY_DN66461_c5_g8_i1.p1 TRINITY_DN66461_c5_g8~~TRINITY_DN66461_c5_g8_i1.p1  ORF type:complete len:726 (+),score=61.13 TRINITY_DN66461_c5_g8_i1:39-2216(+)
MYRVLFVYLYLLSQIGLVHSQDWLSSNLRFEEMENCVYIGPRPFSGLPVTLEWTLNSTFHQGRLTAGAVRSGWAERDGFVGIVLKGDGNTNPTGSPNLLSGWPDDDVTCIKTLYTNTSSTWMGYCEEDNTTLALAPNCTYAEQIGFNGTCRHENDTVPMVCFCRRDDVHGYWGPDPSCRNCTDNCRSCHDHYGGIDCKIPIQTDIYRPDEANVYIRFTWRRNLVDYGHTITPGTPSKLELLWAYRHASLFNTADERCADDVSANLHASSPYDMVAMDTEKVGLEIDWADTATYKKIPDPNAEAGFKCVDATLHNLGYRPLKHYYPEHAATIIGTSWLSSILHLGMSYGDILQLTPEFDIDDIVLDPEGAVNPELGDTLSFGGAGTTDPLVWSQVVTNGTWSSTAQDNFLQYMALAIFAATNQTTTLTYTIVHSVKIWMDGGLIVVDKDGAEEAESATFVITPGWHQFIFKTHTTVSGNNQFKVKFSSGANLQWKFYLNSAEEGQALGGEWVTTMLHLGATADDYISTAGGGTIDSFLLKGLTEGSAEPFEGETYVHPLGSTNPLTWTELKRPDGTWGDGNHNYMVQYFAFAVWSPETQTVTMRYRHDESIRGWLDGSPFISANTWDNNNEQSTSILLTKGWHQFLFKLHDEIGTSYFRLKFDQGLNLRYYKQLPLRCSENPCINGGTCIQSECVCPSDRTGVYCESSWLFGELYQNMRVLLLHME